MEKNQKIATINVTLKDLFFRWIDITSPFHKLTKQKRDVLSLLLYYHYLYKKEVSNDILIWKLVFDTDTRIKIREELNIKDPTFQNILSTLRKDKVIIDNKINPIYIPNLTKNSNNFKVLYNFNIRNE